MANEDMLFKIVIAPAANDRMADHFEFFARVRLEAANRLLDGLTKDICSLERMPYRNPPYNRPYVQSGKYRYLISGKQYRIVYQIEDDTVFVDDIQDMRQNDDKVILK